MRTYKGFAGNVIYLDSSHVIAETQFIKETCLMEKIRDVSYYAPNFTKNGCITITTENNVIPICFTQSTVPMMIEAFSILGALARDNEKLGRPMLGKDGRKIGAARCCHPGNKILKDPGRMNVYEITDALRFEYSMVDQGCTIPFKNIMRAEAFDGSNKVLYSLDTPSLKMKGDLQNIQAVRGMSVIYKEGSKKRRLTFDSRGTSDLFGAVAATLINYYSSTEEAAV